MQIYWGGVEGTFGTDLKSTNICLSILTTEYCLVKNASFSPDLYFSVFFHQFH